MVKRNKGRRSSDKFSINGYTDLILRVFLTGLVMYAVSNIMEMNSNIAVIKVSYENSEQDIKDNKGEIKNNKICINDHEKRLIKVEKT